MNLTDARLKELDDPSLGKDERVLLRCRLSAELIHVGRYDAARETLGGLWKGIGERPDTEGLKPVTAAEALLRCGTLSSWLGHIRHVAGAQDKAKDLLSEALRIFKAEGQHAKASEAHYELGMCYLWLGAYDEARVILDEGLDTLRAQDADLRANILIRHTIVEIWTGRYRDALEILERAREFFEASGDVLKGRWHGQKGLVLRHLATSGGRADHFDSAIIEYTAAIFHYERAGHERHSARNYNNLAFLLYKLGRYREAHENLDRAQLIFTRLKDPGSVAQVDETRARVLVAEKKYTEASRIIASVMQAFEQGGDAGLLADAMIIQGIVWARTEGYASSMNILRQAVASAYAAGATSNAALAALTVIEEHGARRLPETELFETYQRADALLRNTQDYSDLTRLRECAKIIIKRLSGLRLSEHNFSLQGAIHDLEARFVEQALEETRGSITHAAKLLGIARQSLVNMLKTRHRKLAGKRTPARKRRRSIIQKPEE